MNDEGSSSFRTRPVEQENWADLERLFEGRGGPFYCWCTLWREKPPLPKEKTERRNMLKAVLRAQVDAGVPVGIVGYLADEPVGWCSIAPRGSYSRRLGGLPNEAENEAPVWAIACFFLHRQFRGQGLMKQLLQAAIAHARSRGAGVVEAYPVDPESPSYHFMGVLPLFEKLGFQTVGRTGTRRHIVRLTFE